MWFVGLPRPWVPLWQLAQEPGATPVWEKLVGFQAALVWQASHDCVVAMCVAGLTCALAKT